MHLCRCLGRLCLEQQSGCVQELECIRAAFLHTCLHLSAWTQSPCVEYETACRMRRLIWCGSMQMQGRLWAEEGRSGSVHAAMVDAAMRLHEGVKSKHSDLDFFLQNSPGQRREASHF